MSSIGETNCAILVFSFFTTLIFVQVMRRISNSFEILESLRKGKDPTANLGQESICLEFEILPRHFEEFMNIKNAFVKVELKKFHVTNFFNKRAAQGGCYYRNVPMDILKGILVSRATPEVQSRLPFYFQLILGKSFSIFNRIRSVLSEKHVIGDHYSLIPDVSIERGISVPNRYVLSELKAALEPFQCPHVDPPDIAIFFSTHSAEFCVMNGPSRYQFWITQNGETYAETDIYGFEDSVFPECMICCDDVANSILIPCGHTSTCEECSTSFRDSKCPIFRQKISMRITIPIIDTRPPSTISRRRSSNPNSLVLS